MTARTIAHFQLLRKLGEGGMGQVWLADDLRLARRVALKLLPDLSSDDGRKKRALLQEARAAAGLTHPNVCVIYEAAESPDGIPFISMEPIEGHSLKEIIGGPRLPIRSIISIGAQIANALAAAHEKHIVHRDMKPGNVVITEDGRVKVLDFGLAKVLVEGPLDETAVRSQTGQIVGTTLYMSPEQCLGHKLDHRTDIFSLGAVLYEMTTGKRPFEGRTISETLDRILEAEPDSVHRLNPQAPPGLETIIRKCLRKDPARRYQSAADIAVDLRALEEPAAAEQRVRRTPLLLGTAALIALLAIGVHVVTRSDGPPAATETQVIRSIAVLPFVNLSAEKENEYFSDGLSEELLNSLAQVKGLRVAARTSSFQFKNAKHDIGEIGRKLNVETVLEGSVRKSGTKLRITAQLINVADGYHLWSKTYERELEDVFAIQEDMSNTIVANLMPRFHGSTGSRPTADVEAYDLYLQGRHQFWQGGTEENLRRAADFFRKAVQKDPHFALAHANLSDAYMLLGSSGYVRPREIFPQATESAKRSIELNDRLAEGYVALASINWLYEWDWEAADRNYRRSFSVNPLLHTRCICYGWYLAAVGNIELAVVEAERARDLDPLARLPRIIAAWMYFLSRRETDAQRQLDEIFALNVNDVSGRRIAAWTHWRHGRVEEALAEMHRIRDDFDKRGGFASKAPHIAVADLASMYARAGRRGEARQLVESLRERSGRQHIPPENIGAVYAALGEMDEAMRWLDRAYENRSNLAQFNVLPFADPLRAEPRYQKLLERIGLPSRARQS